MVPNGWNLGVFSDGIELISGQHVEAKFVNTVGNGKPYLTGPADFPSGKIVVTKYTENAKKECCKGDLLITVKGSGTGKVIEADAAYAISRQLMAIRSTSFDPKFCFYNLVASIRRYEGAAAGLIPGISREDVLNTPIMVPPHNEQRKIAKILSTWDKAISTTERLIDNSKQQKKALMQQLLTGKKRLLDENGVRFSGEWKKGKLSDIANIDSGYAFKSNDFTDSDKGIPIIRMSDFKAGGIDISSAAKVIPESTIGLDRFKLKTGDFVFGMSGSLSNYGWVKERDLPCFLNQRVGRILAKECAVQLFVTYLYLSDKIQQSILDKAAGAAQLNISSTDLRTTIVHYPCYEEQQKIAAVLSTADQEISALQQKLDALKQEKKALMQQLLTGKRRVLV